MQNAGSNSLNLTEIVERIRQDDKHAERQLVERYYRGLMLVIKRKSTADIAQDVTQETWRIVIEKIRSGDIRDPEKLPAFIVQTGKNQLIMHYRNQNRLSDHVDNIDEELDLNGPHEQLEQVRAKNLTHQLLSQLTTQRDREIIHRYYLLEEDKEAICVSLDLSEIHFNRVVFRAKQRLKALAEHLGFLPTIN